MGVYFLRRRVKLFCQCLAILLLLFLGLGLFGCEAEAAEAGEDCLLRKGHCELTNETLKCHNFNTFPTQVIKLENVEKLDLGPFESQRNHLGNLSNGAMVDTFTNLPNLRWLSLSGCSIYRIEKGAFRGRGNDNNNDDKFIIVDLSDNNIQNLDLDVFVDVFNLEQLDLSNNPLGEFKSGAVQFPRMKLQWLVMKNCSLSALDPSLLDNLVDLRVLHLGQNQLMVIEHQFFNHIKNLQVLHLEGNQLAAFDESIICDLKHLSFFTFQRNPLFCNCDVINLMDLLRDRNVKFAGLPDCSFKTPAYNVALLASQTNNNSNNSTTTIFDLKKKDPLRKKNICPAFGKITLVEECRQPSSDFKEGNCTLEEYYTGSLSFACFGYRNGLPRNLPSLLPPSLSSSSRNRRYNLDLYKGYNNIKILKAGELQKTGTSTLLLEELILSGCQMQIIEYGAFQGGEKLKMLMLEANLLANVDAGVFSSKDLGSLEMLELNKNPIQKFKAGSAFPYLPNLKTLSLENCKLILLENGIFKNLPNLRTLRLNENLIKTLNGEVFRPFYFSVSCIRLEDNPWNCSDGQVKDMVKFLHDRDIHFVARGSRKCPDGSPFLAALCNKNSTSYAAFLRCMKALAEWRQDLKDLSCSTTVPQQPGELNGRNDQKEDSENGINNNNIKAIIITALLSAAGGVSIVIVIAFCIFIVAVCKRMIKKRSSTTDNLLAMMTYHQHNEANEEGDDEKENTEN